MLKIESRPVRGDWRSDAAMFERIAEINQRLWEIDAIGKGRWLELEDKIKMEPDYGCR